MKHFRPDNVVRGRFGGGGRGGGRDRGRWTDPRDYRPRRDGRLSGTTVGVVLAAAICAGLAVGLGAGEPPATAAAAPDKPILWNETQTVPRAEPAPEDVAWAMRGSSPGARQEEGRATPAASATIPFFGYCHTGGGANCVVDGDTFYFGRDKVRIAGIDAPETHPPRCADEARLGEAATHRLRELLNSGEVSLSRIDRDEDVYGRKLRNVAVGGADVGAALVGEGLARDYGRGRRSWCG